MASVRWQDRELWAPTPRALGLLLAAVLCWYGGTWLLDGLDHFAHTDWSKTGRGDAAVDWGAARLFWQGKSPYSPEGLRAIGVRGFGHPPTTSFWFLPLARFDHATMAQIVGILSVALTLALVATAVFQLRLPYPYATTLFVFGFVQDSPPAFEHARVIQLSIWIAFLLVSAWHQLRRNRDGIGGLLLGAACTLKPFPGVIVLWLLLRGRFRVVLGAVATFSVTSVVMTARFGLEAWPLFFAQQKDIAARWIWSVRNASLHGVLRRALGPTCGRTTLSDAALSTITVAACLVLLVGTLWLAQSALKAAPGRRTFDIGYAACCVLAPFINPWIWQHYAFILILPCMVLVRLALDAGGKAWSRLERLDVGAWRSLSLFVLGLLPVALLARWYQIPFLWNALAYSQACGFQGDSEQRTWLLRKSAYYVTSQWLAWAVMLVALGTVLAALALKARRSAGAQTPPPR